MVLIVIFCKTHRDRRVFAGTRALDRWGLSLSGKEFLLGVYTRVPDNTGSSRGLIVFRILAQTDANSSYSKSGSHKIKLGTGYSLSHQKAFQIVRMELLHLALRQLAAQERGTQRAA